MGWQTAELWLKRSHVRHSLQGPSSPIPPTQPEFSRAPSGHGSTSTLDEEVRYQPTEILSVAVVVPSVGHEVPVWQIAQETWSSAGSES